MTAIKKEEPINIGKSTLIRFFVMVKKPIISGNIPNPRKILVMLDPMTSPITISDVPAFIANSAVNNSGRDVPTDTMVTPIMNAGMCMVNPIFSAEPVKRSEDFINKSRLTLRITNHDTKSIIVLLTCFVLIANEFLGLPII